MITLLSPRLKAYLLTGVLVATSTGYAAAQSGGEMPPPAVGVVELAARAVPVMSELPGRIAATRVAEVRARVSGILQERVFAQGSLVKEGDVLYRIDPRLFRVRVASAEASLQKAKAVQQNARQQLERQKTLRERNVATGIDYDTAAVNLAQADADVALAEAMLEEAQINLEYTEVRAPITGIIGAALVTEGALVTADGTSNLALIQQVDPVYADFTQSAQDLMNLKRAVEQGKLASPAPGQARVELVFDNGTVYGDSGRLLFASASVEPTTGQVTLRAEFPNPKGDLLPGMYVRVRVEQAIREAAVTVPQRAVLRTEAGQAQVYVVDAEGTAELRNITLGAVTGSDWVVESGLNDGDSVIVDGVQKVQPGGKVAAEPWTPTASPGDQNSRQDQATE
ncbi:efflux RND transporter periplasmic adaptor subunit [Neorhizobium sp. T786]|uniref:efflux RND transporter periplasmic adaptor subunit n=1 Tax=Pseudorhizobium xiangyangii TaxID=2883104 RepID=UPI001D000969|nr:efflux RND transporter periplasmic adaptor subunit [Neorhizobium xiangyangii]MCB5201854.1 efflux RND transporter periplasmic adaptor subunit [Neorhizobium xiangyangii]